MISLFLTVYIKALISVQETLKSHKTNVTTTFFSSFYMVWLQAKGHSPSFEVSSAVGPLALITFHISVLTLSGIDHLLTLPAYFGLC